MGRIDVTLVSGGMYHDIDFARRQLLDLLGEHDEFRVRVQPDYEDTSGIAASSILVSYTCNLRPSLDAQQQIRSWVESGGRWVALHGTNSALDVGTPNGVDSPRVFPLWADTLGSQFVAHPPIMPYLVEPATTGSSPTSRPSRPTTSCTCRSTPTATHWSRSWKPRGRARHEASSNPTGPPATTITS